MVRQRCEASSGLCIRFPIRKGIRAAKRKALFLKQLAFGGGRAQRVDTGISAFAAEGMGRDRA